jgi:asparagine synthase (glutamine-hydrolysing)
MPGIVGLVTKMPRKRAEAELARMIAALGHESFYETGTWSDESLGVYVGWTVMQNAQATGMPLRNEQGDVSLVFSGEDNAKPGTARALKERGHALDLEGLSYLVHMYEDDPRFPVGLNGMFHGILVDRRRSTAMLFNDRYGMHRLYYHESKEAFYFAAEAKAILAVRPELRRADPRGLGEFIACGCVLENRTLFAGIHVLPAGAAWVFHNSSIRERNLYFQPSEWEQQSPLEPEAYYEELRDAFSRNLPRYFNGHERVGIALTGGLDTRAILAWWKAAPNSLPCYTFGGPYRECQDVSIARQVAVACDQSHSVIPVGNEFLSRFAHYAERSIYLSDASVDLSRCPDLYVSERARAIAPVKVVGTFGSEILRQMAMFKPVVPSVEVFRPEMMSYVRQTGDTYNALRREHPLTFAVFRQFPWYHCGVIALEQSQLTIRSPYLDNDFVRTVYRSPKVNADTSDVRVRLIGDGSPVLGRLRSDLGIGGDSGWLPTAALLRAYLRFTFKAEYAYDYGMPQWVSKADHLFSPLHLERLFLGRHKFLHFRVWYRDILSKYVREMLLDPATLSRPYIDRKGLEAVVNGHLRGGQNYTTEIHKLLTVELLHRLFVDQR